jgi:hypothetical protein
LFVRIYEISEISEKECPSKVFYFEIKESQTKNKAETTQVTGSKPSFKGQMLILPIKDLKHFLVCNLINVDKATTDIIAQMVVPLNVFPENKRTAVSVLFPRILIDQKIHVTLKVNLVTNGDMPFTQPKQQIDERKFTSGLQKGIQRPTQKVYIVRNQKQKVLKDESSLNRRKPEPKPKPKPKPKKVESSESDYSADFEEEEEEVPANQLPPQPLPIQPVAKPPADRVNSFNQFISSVGQYKIQYGEVVAKQYYDKYAPYYQDCIAYSMYLEAVRKSGQNQDANSPYANPIFLSQRPAVQLPPNQFSLQAQPQFSTMKPQSTTPPYAFAQQTNPLAGGQQSPLGSGSFGQTPQYNSLSPSQGSFGQTSPFAPPTNPQAGAQPPLGVLPPPPGSFGQASPFAQQTNPLAGAPPQFSTMRPQQSSPLPPPPHGSYGQRAHPSRLTASSRSSSTGSIQPIQNIFAQPSPLGLAPPLLNSPGQPAQFDSPGQPTQFNSQGSYGQTSPFNSQGSYGQTNPLAGAQASPLGAAPNAPDSFGAFGTLPPLPNPQ